MANVNVGDQMSFNGTPLFYTGSGWTSNVPGSAGNPTQASAAQLNTPIADPWAGLQDGVFNASSYGDIPGAPAGSPATTLPSSSVNDRGSAGRGVPTPSGATSPVVNSPISDPRQDRTYEYRVGQDGPGPSGLSDILADRTGRQTASPLAGFSRTGITVPGTTRNTLSTNPSPGSNTPVGQTPGASPTGQNGLPPGYYTSTGPGGIFQPQGAPTFETYWQQRLGELQSPMITPQSYVAGIMGVSPSGNGWMTPAAQWASEYVTSHPDDPAIAAAGGADAFIQRYNTQQYSLGAIRPDIAAAAGGYGSGVPGSWKGLDDAGAKLLTYGVGQGMQPAYDAAPSDIYRSLQLNGINPLSGVGQQALGTSNYNLANGVNNGARAIGATPYVGPSGVPGQTQTPAPQTGAASMTQAQLTALIQQLLGGQQSASSVVKTPLGYTEYAGDNSGSNDQTLQALLALISVLGQSSPQQSNYWNF